MDRTFISYVADTLAETNSGLTGSEIVKFCKNAAIEYNRKIPHCVYPFEAKNKRTALFENLMCFNEPEQFKIIKDICELSTLEYTNIANDVLTKLYDRYGEYADKATIPHVDLPQSNEDTLLKLTADIDYNIKHGTPELCLDRLHTFSSKFFREICSSHNINIYDDKGKYQPLQSLVGMLAKYYKENSTFDSEFVYSSIKASISLFDQFNTIRNMNSFAHDNEVLNKYEAEYVIKIISNTLIFIDRIEHESIILKTEDVLIDDDLPF